MSKSIHPDQWRDWARRILEGAGLPSESAAAVAEGLVEGDLYGHSTHGLALLPEYVAEIEGGEMETEGRPEVLADAGAIAVWDARRLPGIWATCLAVDEATRRAGSFGIGGVSIRRSHHIGCLAVFLEKASRQGFLVLVLSSDPSAAHVAPFGGRTPVMTPNPIAAGIPRDPDPILIDVSTSITTAGMCARLRQTGERLPAKWLLDAEGAPTDDPNVIPKGGSILPIGGLDHGHKGFALSLLVEALTQGMSGFGRAEQHREWGASVLVLALAPSRLQGQDSFMRQTNWLAQACLGVPAIHPDKPVRLPGQLALERKELALREGLVLPKVVIEELQVLAERTGRTLPS